MTACCRTRRTAPTARPDELKALIDAAHGLGLMVMLDVVYNHFGPDGAYIHAYAKPFFRDDIKTPWGAAIDFRRPEVRDYFIQNALYWLRSTASTGCASTPCTPSASRTSSTDLARTIRAQRSSPAGTSQLVLEHEGNRVAPARRPAALRRAMGRRHASLPARAADRRERGLLRGLPGRRPTSCARCLAEGFAYQGEMSPHRGEPRGEPSGDLPPTAFVICLQNHDQIGNRAMGERLTALADPQALRAATALLLLAPFIPMLFMGEEWAQHDAVPVLHRPQRRTGRAGARGPPRASSSISPRSRTRPSARTIPDPNAPSTFAASVPRAEPTPAQFDCDRAACWRCGATMSCPAFPAAAATGAEVLGRGAVRGALAAGQRRAC